MRGRIPNNQRDRVFITCIIPPQALALRGLIELQSRLRLQSFHFSSCFNSSRVLEDYYEAKVF